jgi:hypothetical protein
MLMMRVDNRVVARAVAAQGMIMRRSTMTLLVFLVVVAGIIGANQFLRNQPPFEVVIAVDPLAFAWASDAATRFNASEPLIGTQRVTVRIQSISDVTVWRGQTDWTTANHPHGWLPALSASLRYTTSAQPFTQVQASTARTVLVWGGYQSRLAILAQDTPLDWEQVSVASAQNGGSWAALGGNSQWRFVKFAILPPDRNSGGAAALLSAAATHASNPALTNSDVGNTLFRTWLGDILDLVPNPQTLGADPAATMATRGASTIEIALLPESLWLTNISRLGNASDPVMLNYPAQNVVFDFPLARWNDASMTADQIAAVERFGAFLLADAQQTSALAFGLRPAAANPTDSAALFQAGQPRGIQYDIDLSTPVILPGRTDVLGLIQWYSSQ